LSGRGLCDELITRPEESYRLCCVVVCDLETSRMGAPYIYDIRRLRVNDLTLILLTWRKWWAPNNASKEHMGFNSGFKGLNVEFQWHLWKIMHSENFSSLMFLPFSVVHIYYFSSLIPSESFFFLSIRVNTSTAFCIRLASIFGCF